MNLPISSLNYKNTCTLPNCGGIVTNYTFNYYLTTIPIIGPPAAPIFNYWLDIDFSGGTVFTLEIFACSL